MEGIFESIQSIQETLQSLCLFSPKSLGGPRICLLPGLPGLPALKAWAQRALHFGTEALKLSWAWAGDTDLPVSGALSPNAWEPGPEQLSAFRAS